MVAFVLVASGACRLDGTVVARCGARWASALTVQEAAEHFGEGVPSNKWASAWPAFGQLSGNLAKSLTIYMLTSTNEHFGCVAAKNRRSFAETLSAPPLAAGARAIFAL